MLSKLLDPQKVIQDSIGKYHYSAIITVKKMTIIMINMAMRLINFTEAMVKIVLFYHDIEHFNRFTALITLLIGHLTSL
jgi:hypothetical protein